MLNKSELYSLLFGLKKSSRKEQTKIKQVLLNEYEPLIKKYAMINGEFNEDLGSELKIVLLKCIDSFVMDNVNLE